MADKSKHKTIDERRKHALVGTLDRLDEDDDDIPPSSAESALPYAMDSPPSSQHLDVPVASFAQKTAATLQDSNDSDQFVSSRALNQTPPRSEPPTTPPVDGFPGDIPNYRLGQSVYPAPENERIFKGLIFHFVPNDDRDSHICSHICDAISHGAKWARQWHPRVTHVFVAESSCYTDVDAQIGLANIKPSTAIADITFVKNCIKINCRLDPKNYRSLVRGYPNLNKRPATAPIPGAKRTKRQSEYINPSATPPRGDISDEEIIPSGPPSEDEADPSSLESAIQEIRSRPDVPADLESDQEDGQTTDEVEDQPEDTEAEAADEKASRVPKRQQRFQCMQSPAQRQAAKECPNAKVISVLQEMADHYAGTHDQWRTRSYRIAISNLRKWPTEITTVQEALQIHGVGKRLADKIIEIRSTSRLRRLENARTDETDQALKLFTGIYGVGMAQAQRWISSGMRSLGDIGKRGIQLTPTQQVGFDRYADFAKRIPRAEVAQIFEVVADALREVDPEAQCLPSGSYRRGKQTCGDVDVLIWHPHRPLPEMQHLLFDRLVPYLKKTKFLVAELAATHSRGKGASVDAQKGVKWHGACQLPADVAKPAASSVRNIPAPQGAAAGYPRDTLPPQHLRAHHQDHPTESSGTGCPAMPPASQNNPWRRLDLLLVPYEELGAALLYFTGNDIFNRSMRLLASRKGMRLNQHGLYDGVIPTPGGRNNQEGASSGGVRVAGANEQDIFDRLGVPWRECTERDA